MQEAKRRNIFRLVESGNSLTTLGLVNRIISHRQKFIERNEQKEQKELKLMQVLKNQTTNGQTQKSEKSDETTA